MPVFFKTLIKSKINIIYMRTFDKVIKELAVEKTNPQIIRNILIDMQLHDFDTTYQPMKTFLRNLKKSQSLKPLINNIKKGMSKHSTIIEFAKKAFERNWIKKSKHIEEAIHVAYVYEALTAGMLNSNLFMKEVIEHILYKRREYGLNTHSSFNVFRKIWWITGSLFDALKTISIDSAIKYYQIKRTSKKIKDAYKNKEITFFEYFLFLNENTKDQLGFRINVYEAALSEYLKGFKSNAYVGFAINKKSKRNPCVQNWKSGNVFPENGTGSFYKSLIGPNRYQRVPFDQDFVSLYNSWNLAFVIGNLNDLQYFIPKLIIPSVIDVKPETYLAARVISLWLSASTFIFRRLNNKKEVKCSHKKEMANFFGEINKKNLKNKTHTGRN